MLRHLFYREGAGDEPFYFVSSATGQWFGTKGGLFSRQFHSKISRPAVIQVAASRNGRFLAMKVGDLVEEVKWAHNGRLMARNGGSFIVELIISFPLLEEREVLFIAFQLLSASEKLSSDVPLRVGALTFELGIVACDRKLNIFTVHQVEWFSVSWNYAMYILANMYCSSL